MLTTQQHKPGVLTGNDAVSEFNAQTLPAGSAPSNATYTSNVHDTPPQAPGNKIPASETLGGQTSGEVHTGLGKPMQGMTSNELHHDGGKKSQGAGGAEGVGGSANQSTIDPHAPEMAGQRALDNDKATIGRGGVPNAEDRLAEPAETVANENPRR